MSSFQPRYKTVKSGTKNESKGSIQESSITRLRCLRHTDHVGNASASRITERDASANPQQRGRRSSAQPNRKQKGKPYGKVRRYMLAHRRRKRRPPQPRGAVLASVVPLLVKLVDQPVFVVPVPVPPAGRPGQRVIAPPPRDEPCARRCQDNDEILEQHPVSHSSEDYNCQGRSRSRSRNTHTLTNPQMPDHRLKLGSCRHPRACVTVRW